MNGLYSCIIALSMYSKIPMPRVKWTRERMAWVMCFFPVVGLVEGGLVALWFYLALRVFRFTLLFTALTGVALPLLVTGGIHMDGFIDTMDALHSYGDREQKLNILKDPHIGAFAVISLAVYMLLYGGILYEYTSLLEALEDSSRLSELLYLVPVLVFTMERSLSGLSVVSFPMAKKDGLAAGFADAARKQAEKGVLLIWLVACWVILAFVGKIGLVAGGVILTVQLLTFIWYDWMSGKEFGGVTGDLAGCFLQVCELAGFGAAVIFVKTILIGGMGV